MQYGIKSRPYLVFSHLYVKTLLTLQTRKAVLSGHFYYFIFWILLDYHIEY